jgi:hypothetical protein
MVLKFPALTYVSIILHYGGRECREPELNRYYGISEYRAIKRFDSEPFPGNLSLFRTLRLSTIQ